jgi:hypothetical protein
VLVNDECPADCKLDAVLPGVQQRFQTTEGRFGSMERPMGTMQTKVVTAAQDEGINMRDCNDDCFRRCSRARCFFSCNVCAWLEAAAKSQSEEEVGDHAAGGGLAAEDHQFHVRHKSTQLICNECCGLGESNNMPISEGLDTIEEKLGAKWRKNMRGGGKHMSRMKALTWVITAMSGVDGDSMDDVIGKLDLVFQNKEDRGKQRLSNLVNILKKQGAVAPATSHGPRGRGVDIG